MSKIIIGSDHGGFELKEKIKEFLRKKKIAYEDIGTHVYDEKDDYPDYAFKVAERVSKIKDTKGILICGSGSGLAIDANKVHGIRAVMIYDTYSAEMAKVDNDANIICLRERKFSFRKARKIVDLWLNSEFSNKERHKRILNKIENYEKKRK